MNEIIYAEDGEIDCDATMRAATVSCFTVEAVDDGILISWPSFDGVEGRDWVWQSRAQAEDILNKLRTATKTADV